jgi:proteic killer suppression protein
VLAQCRGQAGRGAEEARDFGEGEAARVKLVILNNAMQVDDLRLPPSNRLEKLGDDRQGQWSFRVNRQWRICFRWVDGDAFDVELVD